MVVAVNCPGFFFLFIVAFPVRFFVFFKKSLFAFLSFLSHVSLYFRFVFPAFRVSAQELFTCRLVSCLCASGAFRLRTVRKGKCPPFPTPFPAIRSAPGYPARWRRCARVPDGLSPASSTMRPVCPGVCLPSCQLRFRFRTVLYPCRPLLFQ